MSQLLQCFGVTVFYFLCYYLFGIFYQYAVKARDTSFLHTTLMGFFAYHLVFFIVALPMKVMLQKLTTLGYIWLGVVLVVAVLTLWRANDRIRRQCRAVFKAVRGNLFVIICLILFTLMQAGLYNLNNNTMALWDESYYIGDVSSSVYTNTISQYDPYSGYQVSHLNTEYVLETYQNHSAVICKMFGIDPLLEVRTVMTSVVTILYQLIFYQIGMIIFKKVKKEALWMLVFLFLLNLYSFNLFTAAEFLIFRTFEGKTILAVIILPGLFYLFMRIVKKPAWGDQWKDVFCMIAASFGLNMSSVFMIPFSLSALLIPLALKNKSIGIFWRYALCMLLCVIFAAAYLLTTHKLYIYT